MTADTRPVPLLILTCAECDCDMPRSIARGLWIADGLVTVQAGFSHECPQCGHIHQPGDVLRFRLGGTTP